MQTNQLSRRQFLKASGLAGGMLLTVPLPLSAWAAKRQSEPTDWCVYVNIQADNTVIMASPVMDMGQHMKTTGPMLIADEMDLDWQLIELAEECPTYLKRDAEGGVTYQYSDMSTGGSHAVRRNWEYMRRAGATARQMLIQEAAVVLGVSASELKTANSFVLHPVSGRRLSYGALAEGASQRNVDPASIVLKNRADYRIMGKDTKTIDLQEIVTGKPLYGIDSEYPGALDVVIHRAPAHGATVKSFDKDAAMAIPGVTNVVRLAAISDTRRDGTTRPKVSEGVAVVATNLWSAMKGKQVLNTQWQSDPAWQDQTAAHQQEKFRFLVNSDREAKIRIDDGNVDEAFRQSEKVLDQVYETPLFAHQCMEPFNCIADIREQDATLIVGHQFPDIVADEVEKITGIDALKVEVLTRRMGGGFGRRYERDFVAEAAALSKQLGHPVKVTWTREDEIERDYFAPAYVMRVRAGLDKQSKIIAWHHRQAQTSGGARDRCFPAKLVENYRSEHFEFPSRIPTGAWRAPGHMQWTFAVESMMDELAAEAGQDQLAFRLALMQPHRAMEYQGFGATEIDSGRMAKCYESAANMAGWGRELPEGHGLGIAGHFTFGSYAAFVIEVSVSAENQLTLHKAWGAIDCGFAVNPNHIRNQMEGGFIDGLSASLFNQVEMEKGRVINNNFHTLRMMRMQESPVDIEVDIIRNDYPPTGVGEPPIAPAAAALTNAIYAACGKRIRRLPVAGQLMI